MRRYSHFLLPLLLILLMSPPGRADDDEDRAALRDAVRRGEIRPLAEILAQISADYHGEIIEVELDEDDGEWVYEIDLLAPTGDRVEFEFDARSGRLLEIEGRNLDRIRR